MLFYSMINFLFSQDISFLMKENFLGKWSDSLCNIQMMDFKSDGTIDYYEFYDEIPVKKDSFYWNYIQNENTILFGDENLSIRDNYGRMIVKTYKPTVYYADMPIEDLGLNKSVKMKKCNE